MSRDLERLLRDARALLPDPRLRATMRARDTILAPFARRRRRGWRFAALGGVLAAAIAIGGVAGLLVAPSGSATSQNPFAGVGFLPADGWTVVQAAHGPRVLKAIAANVPVDPRDVPTESVPVWTVADLPPDGIVIFAEFSLRGRSVATDAGYPERALPFELADAYREQSWNAQVRPQRPVAQYRLAGAVAGYNASVRVYIGDADPSPETLALAQRQLDRLAAAAEPVTISAQPTLQAWAQATQVGGFVSSGRENEDVDLEERRCGSTVWSKVASTHTDAEGGWHLRWGSMITTSYRARWRGNVSGIVTVRVRPNVSVKEVRPGRFLAGVLAFRTFEGKSAVVERFDRVRERWIRVKTIRFTDSGITVGTTYWTNARFRARLPRGVLVRVVLPTSQARPCYVAAVSNMLRTGGVGGAYLAATEDRVTLSIQPQVTKWPGPAVLSGSISTAADGERVLIDAKECSNTVPLNRVPFRQVAMGITNSAGSWRLEWSPGRNTIFRARWRSATSAHVRINVRASPGIGQERRGYLRTYGPGPYLVLQRWARARGAWVRAKIVRANSYSKDVRLKVPTGTLVRAFAPRPGPCYVPGYSPIWRAW